MFMGPQIYDDLMKHLYEDINKIRKKQNLKPIIYDNKHAKNSSEKQDSISDESSQQNDSSISYIYATPEHRGNNNVPEEYYFIPTPILYYKKTSRLTYTPSKNGHTIPKYNLDWVQKRTTTRECELFVKTTKGVLSIGKIKIHKNNTLNIQTGISALLETCLQNNKYCQSQDMDLLSTMENRDRIAEQYKKYIQNVLQTTNEEEKYWKISSILCKNRHNHSVQSILDMEDCQQILTKDKLEIDPIFILDLLDKKSKQIIICDNFQNNHCIINIMPTQSLDIIGGMLFDKNATNEEKYHAIEFEKSTWEKLQEVQLCDNQNNILQDSELIESLFQQMSPFVKPNEISPIIEYIEESRDIVIYTPTSNKIHVEAVGNCSLLSTMFITYGLGYQLVHQAYDSQFLHNTTDETSIIDQSLIAFEEQQKEKFKEYVQYLAENKNSLESNLKQSVTAYYDRYKELERGSLYSKTFLYLYDSLFEFVDIFQTNAYALSQEILPYYVNEHGLPTHYNLMNRKFYSDTKYSIVCIMVKSCIPVAAIKINNFQYALFCQKLRVYYS